MKKEKSQSLLCHSRRPRRESGGQSGNPGECQITRDPHFREDDKKYILALAPMAGYTDSAFRVVCLEGGADLVYTEMISAEALARGNKKTLKMLEFLAEEKNVVVQLFGKNPEAFGKATRIINSLFCHPHTICHPLEKGDLMYTRDPHFREDDNSNKVTSAIAGIDINFGCPAHKVFKTGAGAALMDNKKIAREIILAVLENTNLPVSVKIRSKVKNTTAEEFIDYIKDLDFKMVMVHGRTLNQGMAGEVDFETIKKIKKILPNKIVLGNGGIGSPEDALEVLEKTGVDGIGIGRGALGRPNIFNECKKHRLSASLLTTPLAPSGLRPLLKKGGINFILRQAELFLQQNDNLIPLRKHLVHYFKGQKNASEWRQKIIKIKTMFDLEQVLKNNSE